MILRSGRVERGHQGLSGNVEFFSQFSCTFYVADLLLRNGLQEYVFTFNPKHPSEG